MQPIRWSFSNRATRCLHNSAVSQFPRQMGIPAPPLLQKTGMLHDEDILTAEEEEDKNEGTSAGHILLDQQREALQYMRLIEHDMPRLVRWRVPFVPPTAEAPLVVRTIDYSGEPHPATAKRVIFAPLARLPLETPEAVHTFKLLAGNRWTPRPPLDSGIEPDSDDGEHGYIKISCERFPQAGMNLKWISDVLDNLINESIRSGSKFADLPQDTRHVDAKKRKAKKGESRTGRRPTLADFPQGWLPKALNVSETLSAS